MLPFQFHSEEMEKKRVFSIFIFFLYFSQLLVLQLHASSEYTRHGPRPLIVNTGNHDRSDSDPQQVHISLVGKDHMKVSFVTSGQKAPSTVEYGKTPGRYEASATGEHTKYTFFFYESGTIHHVVIGPLEPQTTYYYRCGGSGPEFSFRTPVSALPIEFVVVGDLGQTEWTASTLAHIGAMDYDVLLLPGDLSYADLIQPRWDSFGRIVEPYASKRPWMVTTGNHDVESILGIPEPFKAYNARWPMAYQESGSTSNLYYSFDVAGTHVIMLGSYTDFDAESDQYKWLSADLGKVDRSVTPWLVALLHTPWYSSNKAHQGSGESMRKAMEEMLYKARVDVVYAGHVHAYERFTRVYNKKEDPCGPVYVTIGDGGNREGLAMSYEKPSPSISLYREPSFGHGRLRIVNTTHAFWAWRRNNDSDSVVGDELWLESLSSSTSACMKGSKGQGSSSSKLINDEL